MRPFCLGAVALLAACSDPARCGDGKIEPEQVCYEPGGSRTFPTSEALAPAVRLADVTGDGIDDAVVARGQAVHVAPGDGTGDLGPTQTPLEGGMDRRIGPTVDLDGDGRHDVVLGSHDLAAGTFVVEVLVSRGSASRLSFESVVLDPGATAIGCMAHGELDGDGAVDLLVEVTGPADLPQEEAGLVVLRGNGDGTFQPRVTHALTLDNSGYVGMAVGDFDDDGRDDMVRNASLAVELRRGAALDQVEALEAVPGSLAVMDVDEDGVDDLVIVHDLKPALSVLLGASGAGLGPAQSFALPPPNKTLAFPLDVDADGRLELATWQTSGEALEILRVRPDGIEVLGEAPLTAPGELAVRLVTGELNGDGITDLAEGLDDDVVDDRVGLVLWTSAP